MLGDFWPKGKRCSYSGELAAVNSVTQGEQRGKIRKMEGRKDAEGGRKDEERERERERERSRKCHDIFSHLEIP